VATLDDLAHHLNTKLQDVRVSFVDPDSPSKKREQETAQLRFDIVMRIIEVKKAERDAVKRSREVAAERKRILEILQSKDDEALVSLTRDELRQKLADMSDAA
jgi:hypothetical protein